MEGHEQRQVLIISQASKTFFVMTGMYRASLTVPLSRVYRAFLSHLLA
jgi:hypothetical protein